jgi:hypothetical protein
MLRYLKQEGVVVLELLYHVYILWHFYADRQTDLDRLGKTSVVFL